jgi:uncharacterized protein (TIGR03000 family)
MRRVLAFLACSILFSPSTFADEIVFPDGTTSNQPGGLMIIRKGNQTTWSVGGAFLSRHVKVVTKTPEGKEITRFNLPSVFHGPQTPLLPESAPAFLHVEISDTHALLFVEGELVRTQGTSRQLESPVLAPGQAHRLRLRAAYVVGDKFVIEDKEVFIRAGENTVVTFDGSRALSVPLRRDNAQVDAPPASRAP